MVSGIAVPGVRFGRSRPGLQYFSGVVGLLAARCWRVAGRALCRCAPAAYRFYESGPVAISKVVLTIPMVRWASGLGCGGHWGGPAHGRFVVATHLVRRHGVANLVLVAEAVEASRQGGRSRSPVARGRAQVAVVSCDVADQSLATVGRSGSALSA